jgi:hypothetical protein
MLQDLLDVTLNRVHQMMVERYPNFKEKVGGSILGCEISSLPAGKLVRWSTATCALASAYWLSLSKIH